MAHECTFRDPGVFDPLARYCLNHPAKYRLTPPRSDAGPDTTHLFAYRRGDVILRKHGSVSEVAGINQLASISSFHKSLSRTRLLRVRDQRTLTEREFRFSDPSHPPTLIQVLSLGRGINHANDPLELPPAAFLQIVTAGHAKSREQATKLAMDLLQAWKQRSSTVPRIAAPVKPSHTIGQPDNQAETALRKSGLTLSHFLMLGGITMGCAVIGTSIALASIELNQAQLRSVDQLTEKRRLNSINDNYIFGHNNHSGLIQESPI